MMRTDRSYRPAPLALTAAAVCLMALSSGTARAQGTAQSIDDVSPVDLPFVAGDQGIPFNGNTINTDNVDAQGFLIDIFGNRIQDENGNDIGQFEYERNANIEVGRSSSGQLLLSGGVVLRFGDLIIGGDTTTNNGANNIDVSNLNNIENTTGTTAGSGLVSLTGPGTLYNSHPLIVPTRVQDPGNPELTVFTIPDTFNPGPDQPGGVAGTVDEITNIARPGSNGTSINGGEFDLYVGLTGIGTLQIDTGARAEIHDAAFIGVGRNAVGTVNVDGLGAYLGVYSLKSPSTNTDADGDASLIGVYGTGTLNITNGGTVDMFGGAALGSNDVEGDGNRLNVDPLGQGFVYVDGAGSTWRVFAPNGVGDQDSNVGLAVGQYREVSDADAPLDAVLSNLGLYDEDAGQGTLTITGGGFVTVEEDNSNGMNHAADMRIGQQGTVQLAGGRLSVDDRLDNDGLIRTGAIDRNGEARTGDGRIESATFLNSPLGRVEISAGETLELTSTGEDNETITAGMTGAIPYFYANFGQIEVLGDQAVGKAEFVTIRDFDPTQNNTPQDDRFKNLIGVGVTTTAMAPETIRGQIKAQDANLFFRSGLLNQADLNFTGGDNVVSGDVENATTGFISITNESHVTFQDDVLNDGIILLNDESDVTFAGDFTNNGFLIDLNPAAITVAGDFSTDGLLDFVIGGGPTGLDFTRLGVLGDATFGANSGLVVDAISLSNLVAGDSFDLISVAGTVTDLGLTTLALPTAPTGLTFLPDTDLTDGLYTLGVQAIPALALGADFNGDGVVDLADVDIWRMFFGLQSGATIALGDVDGDGDVDARDFFLLQQQLATGVPMAVPGAGAGSGFVENVPEPSAAVLMLLAAAGLLPGRRAKRR